MKKAKGKDLVFISWILRDGSGTEPVVDQKRMDYYDDEEFKLLRLSISEDTYIASGFNSYVVRLKAVCLVVILIFFASCSPARNAFGHLYKPTQFWKCMTAKRSPSKKEIAATICKYSMINY